MELAEKQRKMAKDNKSVDKKLQKQKEKEMRDALIEQQRKDTKTFEEKQQKQRDEEEEMIRKHQEAKQLQKKQEYQETLERVKEEHDKQLQRYCIIIPFHSIPQYQTINQSLHFILFANHSLRSFSFFPSNNNNNNCLTD